MIRECDARSISEVIELGEDWAEQHKVETFDSSQAQASGPYKM